MAHSQSKDFSEVPANPFSNFTEYGIGIGLRVPHYQHILAGKSVVDWFEIKQAEQVARAANPW